jgi:hypothetical protein
VVSVIRTVLLPSIHDAFGSRLRHYNQLIAILVAFLEATDQQVRPIPPQL